MCANLCSDSNRILQRPLNLRFTIFRPEKPLPDSTYRRYALARLGKQYNFVLTTNHGEWLKLSRHNHL